MKKKIFGDGIREASGKGDMGIIMRTQLVHVRIKARRQL